MTDDDSSDDRNGPSGSAVDVSGLASAVISTLADKTDQPRRTIQAGTVRYLVRAVLRPGYFNAENVLREMRDNRLGHDQILDIYVPEAARVLGEMWAEDTISFAEVTIASSRLQGLLTQLAPPWSGDDTGSANHISVLLVLVAGSAHSLGPHVVAAQCRRTGASVRILFETSAREVTELVADRGYDLVLFSCARAEDLAPIAKIIKRLRGSATTVPPVVLGGQVLSQVDGLKEQTDVDLVTNDYRVALRLCDPALTANHAVTRK